MGPREALGGEVLALNGSRRRPGWASGWHGTGWVGRDLIRAKLLHDGASA